VIFVCSVLRFRERRRPPAVVAADVQLVLVDDEAAAFEQIDPGGRLALQLPALVVVHARRHAHE
jgi:hypothetical protein